MTTFFVLALAAAVANGKKWDEDFLHNPLVDNPLLDFKFPGSDFTSSGGDHSLLSGEEDEEWDEAIDWDSLGNFDELFKDLPSMFQQQAANHTGDLDILPDGPCQSDLLTRGHCEHSDSKAVCLWMDGVDSARWAGQLGSSDWYRPLSLECKEHLVDFLTNASSHPFEYFQDLRVECGDAITSLCEKTTQEQTALACLRSNFDSIQQPNCRDEIVHLNSWSSLNATWWSPTLWRDCAVERRGVCTNSTSSGLSDFRDCLDDNREDLSEPCHKSLFQSDLQAAPNPYSMRQGIRSGCKTELKQFCSDVATGEENQLFCLYRASKRSGVKFDPSCAEAVEGVVKVLESDYRMNVPIRKFCKHTINQFCATEKAANDKQAHESDEVMGCLKRVLLYEEHKDNIDHADADYWQRFEETEACMHAVKQSVLIDSLDWEVDSSLHSNCYHDYHKLLLRLKSNDITLRDHDSCAGETPQECLQSHFHDIEREDCQKAVALNAQLSALDQDFKPHLLAACALALDQLDCGAETAGEGSNDAQVECLYENMLSIHDSHCRGAIKHDYELSERDFRLSYELSLVCAKDRKTLCGSVDPSDVLQCMIGSVSNITDADCAKDVSRLAFVAVTEGQSVVQKAACATDVAKFCSFESRGHGNVHACLVGHLGELTEDCAGAVLNIQKSSASHAAMETVLNHVCSNVLVGDTCRAVIAASAPKDGGVGLRDKLECISAAIDDEDGMSVPQECQAQLTAVETLLAADYRTSPELQSACKTDVSVLCPSEAESASSSSTFTTRVIQCLMENRGRVRNANCKKQILHHIHQVSENALYLPNMRSVCGDDMKKFCPTVAAGNGQLHQCLRDHIEEMSHDCQSQEFTVEQMEGLAAGTRKACTTELESFCGKAASLNGGELHCLWRNVDEASAQCSKSIKKEMKGKIGNIWLDPSLYTKCRLSVNSLIDSQESTDKCPSYLAKLPVPLSGLIPLPSNYTQAVGGEHVACLAGNRAKIADRGCLKAVEDILKMQVKDPILLRSGLRTACKRELAVNGVCGESDPFETVEQWTCLQNHVRNSDAGQLAKTCSDAVKRMWRLSLIDIKFNPDVALHCHHETETYCPENAGSKTLVCLYEKGVAGNTAAEALPEVNGSDTETTGDAAAVEPLFSEECIEALKRMPTPDSVDYEQPWKRAKRQIEAEKLHEEETVQESMEEDEEISRESVRLLRETAISADRDVAGLALTGPLAFVSLASLFVVIAAGLYRVYRYKMNKGYMVIVEKD